MSAYVDHLHDTFRAFGPVTIRAMFGGHGVYHDGVMFGLVAYDTLYLKEDAENAHRFDERGLEPFTYGEGEKRVRMSYRRAPAEVMESPEAAAEWGRLAFEAAVRSRKGKGRGSRARRSRGKRGEDG